MSIPSQNSRIFTPDLKEWMDRRLRELKSGLNCVSIGTIKAFDATTQTATLQINFLRVIQGFSPLASPLLDLATDYKLSYPLLVNCPVMVLSGGDARLTFPIVVGDTAIVLFADKDIDTWYTTGQINIPNSNRTHDLNDAIAIVGIRSAVNKISDYSTDAVELKYNGGTIKIDADGYVSITDVTGERLPQPGFLQPTAASTAPSGWLLCYGQSLLRADYPYLFAAIGTTYGSADGTHFNVPDYRGRSPIGLDNMGGSNANVLTNTYTPNRNTLGGAIGEQTHTLSVLEIPSHTHTVGTNGFHDQANNFITRESAANGLNFTSSATGGDQPHYNVPPGRMANWLIKT